MSWYGYKPYISVSQRRRMGEEAIRKLEKKGSKLQPVEPEGRDIATTFWGKAWCDNLVAYSDWANRLPRGRSYLSNGLVIDLQISAGKITGMVQGSSLYNITIKIDPLSATRWEHFKKSTAGSVTNLLDLLQGKLSKDILAGITTKDAGLFPSPKEIHMACSCPDWAEVCKHVAAVMYGIGTRLDSSPELFFTLRGVDMQELISEASITAAAPLQGKPGKTALAGADLSELFGVEIEDAAAPVTQRSTKEPKVKVVVKTKAKPAVKAGVKPMVKAKPAVKADVKTKEKAEPVVIAGVKPMVKAKPVIKAAVKTKVKTEPKLTPNPVKLSKLKTKPAKKRSPRKKKKSDFSEKSDF